ncbi:hypothetical protein LSUE1_G007756, partial [Lachnellula suecica]
MSAPSTPRALKTFFSTPEMLESVLLQLPIRDLLVNAQPVSRAWHAAVAASPALQQRLFFQPCRADERSQEPEFNPLLQQKFPRWFKNYRGIKTRNTFHRGEPFEDLEWNKDSKSQNAYARQEASWRRMLPVQPPAQTLQVFRHSSSMGGSSEQEGYLEFDDGVRMGALYDLAYAAVAEPISSFHSFLSPVLAATPLLAFYILHLGRRLDSTTDTVFFIAFSSVLS